MSSLFRKITPESARLHSLFHRHIRGLSFSTEDGGGWTADSATLTDEMHGASIYASFGDGEVTIWLNSPDWQIAAGKVLGLWPGEMTAVPEELGLAALECFASGVLTAIERGSGLPVSLIRLEIGEVKPLSSACFFTITDDAGLRVRGAWSAPTKGTWLSAVQKALASLPVPARRLADDFSLPLSVEVGMWSCPASQFRDLERGDIVLSPSGPERTVTVGGKYRFAARLQEGILTVEGSTMTDALFDMNDDETDENEYVASDSKQDGKQDDSGVSSDASGEPLERFDDVRVEVQARVGTLSVTLGELRKLGEGQVVEFSTPVESPATLVVNGKAIARGELLDVGGRVGVRITDIVD